MNSLHIQTILTLQQLRINNKEIDSLVHSVFPVTDELTISELVKDNPLLPSSKRDNLTPVSVKNAWDLAKEIIESSLKANVQIISKIDTQFPARLKELKDCPQLLHVKGNPHLLKSDCLAIVGTRNPTPFGKEKAEQFSAGVAAKGFTIVSGLAKGVDAAAHEGALKANGFTIAVMAHGLHTIYPAENWDLAGRILKQNGALISEYPWNTGLLPRFLVERDRIQSGISLGILVIETGVKGGTMHTVKNCTKQNRLLMVLQHPEEYSALENTLGNKEIISKFSGSDTFRLVKQNDTGETIVEKIRTPNGGSQPCSQSRAHHDPINPDESGEFVMQQSLSGFSRAVKKPLPKDPEPVREDCDQNADSRIKNTEVTVKANQKGNSREEFGEQKTLF